MFTVELYAGIRRAVMVGRVSRREAAKRFGVHRNTITKMLQYPVPPGYRRRERPVSKKLGPYMAWIDKILEDDRSVHKKQRHTARRLSNACEMKRGFPAATRSCGSVHACPVARPRDVRSLEPSPGSRAGGFWPGGWLYRGQEGAVPLLLRGSAALGRLLLSRPIQPRRLRLSATAMWRRSIFSAACRNRFLYNNTRLAVARSSRAESACAHKCSRNSRAITCSPTALADRARATTKARSRAWSDLSGATS